MNLNAFTLSLDMGTNACGTSSVTEAKKKGETDSYGPKMKH